MPPTSAVARDARWPRATGVVRDRRWRRVAVAIAVLTLLIVVGANVAAAPLRRLLERRVNAALDAYTVSIGGVVLNPFGFALELHDVTLVQNAHPDPPVALLPRWKTSLQWRALLRGAVVADVLFERPTLWITKTQAEAEDAEAKPVTDHGWQQAVESVYPLEINAFRVHDGRVNYYDTGPLDPVRLESLELEADDIRNVRSRPRRYPSPLRLSGRLAAGGRVWLEGRADFLATPQAAVRGRLTLDGLHLDYLAPLARHADAEIKGGRLALRSRIESAAGRTRVDVTDLAIDQPRVDVVHRPETAGRVEERAQKAAHAAAVPETQPPVEVTVRHARIVGGELALSEQTTTPAYRLFLADPRITLVGFSNAKQARNGRATVDGRFMGSGATHVDAEFGGAGGGPDLGIDARVENVDLPSMNDLLRASGGFDVAAGRMSIYAQARVKNREITGYVKPLFADLEVYDRRQDKDKNVVQQLYEGAVDVVGKVLRNRERDEVATVTDLSGHVEEPNTSTWQVIGNLVWNAFVKAILPGLERQRAAG